MLTIETTTEVVPVICLADNEWGNELMLKVAMECFEANPEVNFIEVREHGGWYLGYRRDGSVWCSANDGARLTKPLPQPPIGCRCRWTNR